MPMPSLHRLLVLPTCALERLRLLLLVATLPTVVLVVADMLSTTTEPLAERAVVVIASLALLAHWVIGYRRRHFAPWADVPEAALIGVTLALVPSDPLLPLLAMLFRSLYGGTMEAALRSVSYAGAVYLSHAGDPGRAIGLALGAALMQTLVRALESSERSERRLLSVIENASDVVTIVAPDGTISWQASSVRAVLGHDPERLVGSPFGDLVHPDDRQRAKQQFAQVASTPGASATVSIRIRDASGSYRDVEAVGGNRVHDPHIGGYVLHLRDATERVRLERERLALEEERSQALRTRLETERLRERLESQRERQRLEARLQQSQRLETVGQLAAGVAHDFNNLLAVIITSAGFVRDDLPGDAPLQADLQEIEEAAQRGARLTKRLLTFSKRSAAKPEVVELNAVIGGLGSLLARTLGDQRRLRQELDPALWRIEADVTNLEQVLMNLVVNARDALPDGGEVMVRTENVEVGHEGVELELPPGRYVRLTVADDGCGMDEVTLARALEPFYSTKAPGTGTGLGLATVAAIVADANGQIDLASRPGEGTQVQIHLPATAKHGATRPEAGDDRRDEPTEGERILVVEDEPGVRAVVTRILTKAGYGVVAADCGDAALDVVDAEPRFDLVLTDVLMPGMSGHELAARLRERDPDRPVLFMTGYSDEAAAHQAAGTERVISKPFSADALREHVREMLRGAAPVG